MKINYNLYPGRQRFEEKEYEQKEPVISIITAYYNSYKFIDKTANSVLNQTFPYFEWLIIDDGSTGKEDKEKLEEIAKLDKRIKIYRKENGGVAEARDYGSKKISQSSKYIVFLDADDLIIPTYLECAYWTLETNSEASWAYTDTVNFDGENYTWTKWYQVKKEIKENLLVATALIRRDAFFAVNGYEIRDKNVYEDWCLWLKMIKSGMYPVRMNFYGFWYRKKQKEESQLYRANEYNKDNAMKYVNEIAEEIEKIYKRGNEDKLLKEAIQYPKEDYNWDEIQDMQEENIIIPKTEKNGKINILLIIPWMVVGGADKFNLDIIKRANKEKFEFTIITTEPSKNEWRQEFEEYAPVYDLTTFLNRKDWISFINYIIEKNNIDIIFNTNSTFGYSAIPYLKIKHPDIPVIDYVHMEEWYNRNGGFSRDSSGVASFIDKTYLCNKNSERVLVEHFKRNEEEVSTIYIGVDEKKYDPKLFNKDDILKEKGINNAGKYIISYICRISEQKRPMLLLKVIEKLKSERNDFLFVIAGDGPMLPKIKKEAKRLKLSDYMIFLGNVKDTEKIYAISDMTINCSIKEGLALTAYESLSMGVPVVSADVGGQKELIDSEVGVIVPCMQKEEDIFDFGYKDEEINEYVKGINKILKNLNEYKSKAREKILNGFTIDNMVSNIEKVFEEVHKNPNEKKIENAKAIKGNIDLSKELITQYLVSSAEEYKWLAENYNKENVDIDWKIEREKNKYINYENQLEYKIKHPIYVVLNKLHIYEYIRPIIKRGEK